MIKKGSDVKILTGKDKNKTGEVIEVDKQNDRIKVKGTNMIKKHVKTTKDKKGGIFEKENFLDPYICKKLIEYQENNSPNDTSKGFWQSRIVTRYDYEIKKVTDVIHARIINSITNFYNHKVYLEFTNLEFKNLKSRI